MGLRRTKRCWLGPLNEGAPRVRNAFFGPGMETLVALRTYRGRGIARIFLSRT